MKAIKSILAFISKNMEWFFIPLGLTFGVFLFWWSGGWAKNIDSTSYPYDVAVLQKFILGFIGMMIAAGVSNIILYLKSPKAFKFFDKALDSNGTTKWEKQKFVLSLYVALLLTYALILNAI